MEHSKDVDAAVDFILYEVLPSLNEPTEGSYNITDSHARENSPVQSEYRVGLFILLEIMCFQIGKVRSVHLSVLHV